ncbi:hypothetical protein U8335_04345 [Roseiconus lacunae]|uniref:hypothetical protein n=1 Tax=Roseiconus lacunae TaxID=2605694 RepID=UPI0030885A9F|nr:hypothetical protein U8335_04345 [Stieleria sp. HD01]
MKNPRCGVTFKRAVRGPQGEIIGMLSFPRGEVIEVTGFYEEAIDRDIGKALVIVKAVPGSDDFAIDYDAIESLSGLDLRSQFKPEPPPMPASLDGSQRRKTWIGRSNECSLTPF